MKRRVYLTFAFIVIIFSLIGCSFPSHLMNKSEMKKQISEHVLKKKTASTEKESDERNILK